LENGDINQLSRSNFFLKTRNLGSAAGHLHRVKSGLGRGNKHDSAFAQVIEMATKVY
jgi:hypothetical protein